MSIGDWVPDKDGYYFCSLCGYESDVYGDCPQYCPACGALMADPETEYRPPTNQERIQDMTTNDLAAWLAQFDLAEVVCRNRSVGHCRETDCETCIRQWLAEPI